MAEEGKIIAVYDIEELEKALKNIEKIQLNIKRDKRLVNTLREYVTILERKRKGLI